MLWRRRHYTSGRRCHPKRCLRLLAPDLPARSIRLHAWSLHCLGRYRSPVGTCTRYEPKRTRIADAGAGAAWSEILSVRGQISVLVEPRIGILHNGEPVERFKNRMVSRPPALAPDVAYRPLA